MTPPPSPNPTLWRFAGYLAGEATVEQAAKWSGRAEADGPALLEELKARLGPQAR